MKKGGHGAKKLYDKKSKKKEAALLPGLDFLAPRTGTMALFKNKSRLQKKLEKK